MIVDKWSVISEGPEMPDVTSTISGLLEIQKDIVERSIQPTQEQRSEIDANIHRLAEASESASEWLAKEKEYIASALEEQEERRERQKEYVESYEHAKSLLDAWTLPTITLPDIKIPSITLPTFPEIPSWAWWVGIGVIGLLVIGWVFRPTMKVVGKVL